MMMLITEIMKHPTYPHDYLRAIQHLIQFYGYTPTQFPTGSEIIITRKKERDALKTLCNSLPGHVENNDELIRTFELLVYMIREHPDLHHPISIDNLISQMTRRDFLMLLILCETTHSGDTIIIKNRSRSFHLHNEKNWFVKDLLHPYILKQLGDDFPLESAILELEKTRSHHRGRHAKDPFMLDLIWNTYQFLSAKHVFRTPMPNALCNFIIQLLQLMDILPENTEIDAFWIRAQLRYMKTKRPSNQAE